MKYCTKTLLVSTLMGTMLGMSCMQGAVQAIPYIPAPGGLFRVPQAAALPDGPADMAPIAFVRFCMVYASQCADQEPDQTIHLNDEAWEQIGTINRTINHDIRPDPRKDGFQWSLETRLGNCNDYAVQKRKALLDAGYPMSALLLAAVMTPEGIGHLVLTIRTDRGDFVLDNLRQDVRAWNRTGYVWLRRQAASNPRQWVAVNAPARAMTREPVIAQVSARAPAKPAVPVIPVASTVAEQDKAAADSTAQSAQSDTLPADTVPAENAPLAADRFVAILPPVRRSPTAIAASDAGLMQLSALIPNDTSALGDSAALFPDIWNMRL